MTVGRFEGRVAIVTGAAGGMGMAIAHELARGGARLVLVDLDQPRLDELAVAFAPPVQPPALLALDLTADGAPMAVLEAARERYGGADILVNNAGITRFGRVEEYQPDDWDSVLAINLRAPFLLSQAFGGGLLATRRPGAIVNIGSIGGRTANPQNIPYGVSKSAILGLTQQLAVEWGPYGIRVNAVNPGLTTWHMRALEPDWAVKRQQQELVPLRRLVEPEDVAAAVAFLASDAARCITGVLLDVDCGYLLSLMSQLPRPERFLMKGDA
jgi:NAD(P)-dependent dehydrogenase (short-subunit alcohol dehydrogenase family)